MRQNYTVNIRKLRSPNLQNSKYDDVSKRYDIVLVVVDDRCVHVIGISVGDFVHVST